MKYYISSCVFTVRFPELSKKIRDYIIESYPEMKIVRCCTPSWKVKIYEDKMSEGILHDECVL